MNRNYDLRLTGFEFEGVPGFCKSVLGEGTLKEFVDLPIKAARDAAALQLPDRPNQWMTNDE